MDRMRLSEVPVVADQLDYADRGAWERTRIQCLVSAQMASRKRLRLQDVFSLPWDDQLEDRDLAADASEIFRRQKALEAALNAKKD